MKEFAKEFCKRGFIGAWGGPAILAIVWLALQNAGVVTEIAVNDAVLGVFSSIVLAFIATGITAVYGQEQLQLGTATLIHGLVLYLDYVLAYLLNGWIAPQSLIAFTLIFVAGYILVWAIIYCIMAHKVKKLNRLVEK